MPSVQPASDDFANEKHVPKRARQAMRYSSLISTTVILPCLC